MLSAKVEYVTATARKSDLLPLAQWLHDAKVRGYLFESERRSGIDRHFPDAPTTRTSYLDVIP